MSKMDKNPGNKKTNVFMANNATFQQRRNNMNSRGGGNSSNSFQMNHTTQYSKNRSDNPIIPRQNASMNQTVPLPDKSNSESKKSSLKVFETIGPKPLPRFGNSFTLISPVQAVLFGGAVGNVKDYKFSNDTYILNFITQLWSKLSFEPGSHMPQGRAAHAAAVTEFKQLVIHGGSIGSSNLAEDELWLLNLNKNNRNTKTNQFKWSIVNTMGRTPGKRYGHTLCYMKPYLILLGGNLNTQLSNEVWIIDINIMQPSWSILDFPENIGPSPRLYHSVGLITEGNNSGMMILFGGRDATDNPLSDIWELRKHRNGQWQWIMAPIKNPEKIKPRYNHSIFLIGTLMIVMGGRGRNSHECLPVNVYDIESMETYEFSNLSMYRQASLSIGKDIYLYGGFNGNNPLVPLAEVTKLDMFELFDQSPILSQIGKYIMDEDAKNINKNTLGLNKKTDKKREQFKLSYDVVVGSGGVNTGEEEMEDTGSSFRRISIDKLREENKRINTSGKKNTVANSLLQSKRDFNIQLVTGFLENLLRPFEWFEKAKMDEMHNGFLFTSENILSLLNEVLPLFEREKSLIKIRSPCKIFGNIYGEYFDLMRFFESFGNPSDDNQMGDIAVMQYVFLGDFCDRCEYSLETVLLLFALKVKFPENIFLIRGHHEDININKEFGLGEECAKRLHEDISSEDSVFKNINRVFDYLPFAILIDENILCLHGGLGASVNFLSDIENIQRPIQINHNVNNLDQQKIIDLLWSEYSEEIDYIENNPERDVLDKGFVLKYGRNRLNEFMFRNNINLIITGHMFIKEGFKTFNEDKLLCVYSASNYMDKYGNFGAMIIVAKKAINKPMNLIPKLINVYQNKAKGYKSNLPSSPIRGLP
ncbi:MAG: metallophosphoesterase [archaeon]|nr:metallophosphoesterase [archaeon]